MSIIETDCEVKSLQEFLRRVWIGHVQPNTSVTLFRGQMHDHPLLPKLFRKNSVEAVLRHEREMLQALKSAAVHLHPSTPENDWDWISLGQHYGMSTRMSDWSASPLVALFFAVESDPVESAKPLVYQYPVDGAYVETSKSGSLWTIPHTRVIRVGRHSHRSEAQAAWQVVHAVHDMKDGSFRFFPLGELPPHDDRITKINISPSHVKAIRDELSLWGVTHSTIYADFGSVCRSIAPSFGLS